MPAHDHFRELSTLAAIGQITAEEESELRDHLRECSCCRDAYAEYSLILNRHLPNASPARYRVKNEFVHTSTSAEIRERFLARAREEGANFSPEVEGPQRVDCKMGMSKGRLALAMASVLILVSATLIATISRQDVQSKKQELARLAQENRGLALQLEKAKLSPTQVPIIVNAGDQNEQERLRKKILALNEEMRRSSERAKAIEGQLAALQTQNGSLAGQHQQDQAAISDLQEKLRREKESSTSTMAALLEAQEKIHSLHMAIMQGNERLAMERQLASATSDIRQLMGARNLHIIDVHDVNASGRTNKSFGRVFYAENQSLVFYAFDLPSSKSAKYTFQAWGQTEGNENSIHNLGTFAVDSHEQHRWVLKVNDSAALRDIDSVFVTAETAGDSALPKGKRVLYAYFAPQANHP